MPIRRRGGLQMMTAEIRASVLSRGNSPSSLLLSFFFLGF